jgi:LmbE family N-acetylglucosaminyl deacetylase
VGRGWDDVRVLGVFAHGDDEVLAAGASLAEHVMRGDEVTVCVMSRSAQSRREDDYDRRVDFAAAMAALQIDEFEMLNFPDNRFDAGIRLDIAQAAEDVILKVAPQLIYTHARGDLSRDHLITLEAVLLACRPHKRRGEDLLVLGGEVLSATDTAELLGHASFQPNTWRAVSDESLDRKIAALECYSREVQGPGMPRSIDAVRTLAKRRGAQAGFPACEAFEIHTWVQSGPPRFSVS